jgi:hypothetical protein
MPRRDGPALPMTLLNPYQTPRADKLLSQPGSLPVRVTGMMTADDSLAALKAVGKWHPWRIPLIVFPVLIWVMFTAFDQWRAVGWFPPLVVLVAGLFLLTFPLRIKRRFVKAFRARTEYAQPVTWTFSDEGLLTETIHAKTLRVWSGFAYVKITPTLIVLAQPGDAMFNFIPRRLFETEGDWLAVTQLLAAKLPVK